MAVLPAGPAASPVVRVPKRPRTESAAAARENAALYLLDTEVVSPSIVGPLAGSLQEGPGSKAVAQLGAEVRAAVLEHLGLPEVSFLPSLAVCRPVLFLILAFPESAVCSLGSYWKKTR
jgi:hypothetical protein